jgi:hypothetical protein
MLAEIASAGPVRTVHGKHGRKGAAMAFVTPTVRRRVLIVGETGSGKTHSLRSTPTPRTILVLPGEHGHDTLVHPDGSPLDPDTQVLVWVHDPDKPSTQVIEEVRKETIRILKTPGLQSFCADGFHQFYEFVIDAMSGGEYFKGKRWQTESREDTNVVDPRASSQAEAWMTDWLVDIHQSTVPYVFFTVWDQGKASREAGIDPRTGKKEKWQDLPQHKMPALFGKASRKILGRFGIVVYASSVAVKGKPIPDKPGKYERVREFRWQTQPDAEVGACAVKGDAAVTAKIPKLVPADWRELAKYLE